MNILEWDGICYVSDNMPNEKCHLCYEISQAPQAYYVSKNDNKYLICKNCHFNIDNNNG